MSHITQERTSIKNPDLTVLRQACEMVAQQHGGTVQEIYFDYNGRTHSPNTKLAIFVPGMDRGIGLKLQANGTLTFIGDSFMIEELYAQIQAEVSQTYVTYCLMLIMQEQGYDMAAVADPTGQGMLVLEGSNYA
jgi:hypothetical protein